VKSHKIYDFGNRSKNKNRDFSVHNYVKKISLLDLAGFWW